jgi:Membrane protein involved in the export of O-antigen and teichoic acid
MNALRKNIVSLFLLQGANYLLPLITVPYLVRVLGPENYGRVAFAQAFIGYFVIFTEYGFNLSATRSVAMVRNEPAKLSKLFSAVIIIKAVLMTLGFLVMLLIVWVVPSFAKEWSLYVLVYLMVVGNVLFPVWLFLGLERMRHITIFTIIGRTIVVIAIFAFVHHKADYRLAAAFQASGSVITGLLVMALIPRLTQVRLCWPGVTQLRQTLSEGWYIFVGTAGASLFNNSNVFILGIFTSPSIVGIFAAAEKIIKSAVNLNAPITQATYPNTAKLQAISRREMLKFVARLAKYQIGIMSILSVFLFILAEPIVTIILGEKYHSSIILIKILAALPVLTAISDILGNQIMLNTGLQKQFSQVFIISGLINITLMLAIVPYIGSVGAAVSIAITETIVMLLRAISVNKHNLFKPLIKMGNNK